MDTPVLTEKQKLTFINTVQTQDADRGGWQERLKGIQAVSIILMNDTFKNLLKKKKKKSWFSSNFQTSRFHYFEWDIIQWKWMLFIIQTLLHWNSVTENINM